MNEEEVRHARLAQEELLYEFASRAKMVAEALIREKEALALAKEAIKNLKNKGLSISEIATIFNLTEEAIKELIS